MKLFHPYLQLFFWGPPCFETPCNHTIILTWQPLGCPKMCQVKMCFKTHALVGLRSEVATSSHTDHLDGGVSFFSVANMGLDPASLSDPYIPRTVMKSKFSWCNATKHVSHEKPRGWFRVFFGDEKVPSYMGIIYNKTIVRLPINQSGFNGKSGRVFWTVGSCQT